MDIFSFELPADIVFRIGVELDQQTIVQFTKILCEVTSFPEIFMTNNIHAFAHNNGVSVLGIITNQFWHFIDHLSSPGSTGGGATGRS